MLRNRIFKMVLNGEHSRYKMYSQITVTVDFQHLLRTFRRVVKNKNIPQISNRSTSDYVYCLSFRLFFKKYRYVLFIQTATTSFKSRADDVSASCAVITYTFSSVVN